MNYKAVEVIWIFFADTRTHTRTDRRTEVFQEVLADLKNSLVQHALHQLIMGRLFNAVLSLFVPIFCWAVSVKGLK